MNWLKDKYVYISEDESEYIATPTSSTRTLYVKNIKTNDLFFVKMTLFTNVANESRHIDWKSALGPISVM